MAGFDDFQRPLANSAMVLDEMQRNMERTAQLKYEAVVAQQREANKPIVDALMEQNRLLQEENARQKAQLEIAQKNEEQAKKETKKAKIQSWISFGVATFLSIAALVVSIISLTIGG